MLPMTHTRPKGHFRGLCKIYHTLGGAYLPPRVVCTPRNGAQPRGENGTKEMRKREMVNTPPPWGKSGKEVQAWKNCKT